MVSSSSFDSKYLGLSILFCKTCMSESGFTHVRHYSITEDRKTLFITQKSNFVTAFVTYVRVTITVPYRTVMCVTVCEGAIARWYFEWEERTFFKF